jgi:hypothetical protein
VKRSRAVHLVLLASAVAALEGCSHQECVDRTNVVVDDRYCQGQAPAGSYGYRWYNGGAGGYVPVGSSVSASGTSRGVFGGAGDAAIGGGGEGAGE